MKKLLLAATIGLTLVASTGCASMGNKIDKMGKGLSSSDYLVYKMSHQTGKIMEYGIIRSDYLNSEEGSDGYYWIGKDDGLLHGLSGDVDHHEVKGLSDEEIIELYKIPADALRIPE